MKPEKIKYVVYGISMIALLFMGSAHAQECNQAISKKTIKSYHKALEKYSAGKQREAREDMFQITKDAPDFSQAFFSLGEFYIKSNPPNVKSARKYFEKAIAICPDSVLYAYYYMGKIYYGNRNYEKAIEYFKHFLQDVDLIQSDDDYYEIKNYLDYAQVSFDLINNPVPFDPKKVEGISTAADEYLPIISPDNDYALFTRRSRSYMRRGLTEQMVEKEAFTFSQRNESGVFELGWELGPPFNKADNEGAASLTIDNNNLYYTVCIRDKKTNYLNCDLYQSHFAYGYWSPIESLGTNINQADTWESQPSVTSSGNTIYFASNRKGGYGGYDIYKTEKQKDGSWGDPQNLGEPINTAGNEKSPFIHTDSQTLYFSSDGHKGVGGYDIFYARQDREGNWQMPINIGYPINSFSDDLGFFVSTDGQYGYYASNRFDKNNTWNLYSFSLYEKARPKKVLFIKGQIEDIDNDEAVIARVELKNIKTKTVTQIPVDSTTGKYVAAILFKDDQILTVKKEGFVYSSRYLSKEDTTLIRPKKVNLKMKKIEVGESYKIDDIYFSTNSALLNNDAQKIIDVFFEFLHENPKIEVEIQGHTDNVGKDQINLALSEKRAKAVYDYLKNKGILESRMKFRGYGETKPVADNQTAQGRALNRRTVFVIKKK